MKLILNLLTLSLLKIAFADPGDRTLKGKGDRTFGLNGDRQIVRVEDFGAIPTSQESFKQVYGENCGIAPASEQGLRIINGEVADIIDHPWQVYLSSILPKYGSILYCAGTIISPKWITTSAHCKHDGAYAYLKTGHQNPRDNKDPFVRDTYETRLVVDFFVHDNYNPGNSDQHDFAVAMLEHDIIFDEFAQPACLPLQSFCLKGDSEVTVTGFGTMEGQGIGQGSSPVLRSAKVPVLSKAQCTANGRYDDIGYPITYGSEFCAGVGIRDACTGDSGGPMVYTDENGVNTVFGTVSWGIGCNEKLYPGVYVQMSRFVHWITQITGVYIADMDYTKGPNPCDMDHTSVERRSGSKKNALFDETLFDAQFIKAPFEKLSVFAYKRCLRIPGRTRSLDQFTDLATLSKKKDKKCWKAFKKTQANALSKEVVKTRSVVDYDWNDMLIKTSKTLKDGSVEEKCLSLHPAFDSLFYTAEKYNWEFTEYVPAHKFIYWTKCDASDKAQNFVMEKETNFIRPAYKLDYCVTYRNTEKAVKTALKVTKYKKSCMPFDWNYGDKKM